MNAQTIISLQRVGSGFYAFTKGFFVEHQISGWRWYSADRAHGGEWRRTKREATLDLMSHLGMSVGATS